MRFTTRCTSKTLVGPMAFWIVLMGLHLGCFFSRGLEIDPKPTITNDTSNIDFQKYTYCLGSGEPIRFLDPFDPAIVQQLGDKFLALYWFVTRTGQKEVGVMDYFPPPLGTDVLDSRVQKNQFWGIKVTNVTEADAGVYKVVLAKKSGEVRGNMEIVMATPPVLDSGMLKLERQVEGGMVNLTCGEFKSLGDPPGNLKLKKSNGQVVASTDTQGKISVTMPKEKDTKDFACEMDLEKTIAASCVTEKERMDWRVADLPQPDPETTTKGDDNTTTPKQGSPEASSTAGTSTIIGATVGSLALLAMAGVGAGVCIKKGNAKMVDTPSQPQPDEIGKVEAAAVEPSYQISEEKDPVYGTAV